MQNSDDIKTIGRYHILKKLGQGSRGAVYLGGAGRTGSTGGGSDTNIFNSHGINAVTLSKGGSNAHTVAEQIKIKDLVDTALLVLEIIKNV